MPSFSKLYTGNELLAELCLGSGELEVAPNLVIAFFKSETEIPLARMLETCLVPLALSSLKVPCGNSFSKNLLAALIAELSA